MKKSMNSNSEKLLKKLDCLGLNPNYYTLAVILVLYLTCVSFLISKMRLTVPIKQVCVRIK